MNDIKIKSANIEFLSVNSVFYNLIDNDYESIMRYFYFFFL